MRQELDLNTKVPVLSWAKPEDIDSGSLEQIKNLANLPFAYHHVALMPDVHVGYGMPIGGVLASVDYIVPNAVGVDIGCGMVAVKTSITKEEFLALRGEVGHEISRAIPRGFRKYSEPQDEDNEIFKNIPPIDLILREIGNAKLQLGTLGSGNHFIDVLFDENNFIWIMLHSGSRNIGKQIADYYNKKADEFTWQHFPSYPAHDLSALEITSPMGREYIRAMEFAQKFAFENRQTMLGKLKKAFTRFFPKIKFEQEINIHHNYARLEEHYGKQVWVHRKGAISARIDELGIIPGSMGSNSYITRGLGCAESFSSASHGAGRRMGRNEAKRQFSIQDVQQELAEKDIKLISENNKGAIEEFTKAYKSIDDVIENQKDLAEVLHTLFPLLVVIG